MFAQAIPSSTCSLSSKALFKQKLQRPARIRSVVTPCTVARCEGKRAEESVPRSMVAVVLAASMAISPITALVPPAHAEALSADELRERRELAKARRLAQVAEERGEGASAPTSFQDLMSSAIKSAPKIEMPEGMPEMPKDMPKFEMPEIPKFEKRFEMLEMPEMPKIEMPEMPKVEMPAGPSAEEIAAEKAAAKASADLQERLADERRAAAQERQRDIEREAKEKAERLEASRQLKEELAAEQRAKMLQADSGRIREASKPKNFAKPEKKSEGPGFVAFTLGRVFGAAYVTAVLLAASTYFKKGGVEVEQLVSEVKEDFSKIENKPITIAYAAVGLVALSTVDFVLNAPVLNLIFPSMLQALGLLCAAKIVVDAKDGGDPAGDLKGFLGKVSKDLPGLKKSE